MQKERWELAFKCLLTDAQVEEESFYENTGIGNEATTVGIGEFLIGCCPSQMNSRIGPNIS